MNIKKDFAFYDNNPDAAYFDSACMSLKPRAVVDAMREYYEKHPACAARSSHALAEQVSKKIDAARTTVRKFISAKKDENIIFTRNTTEAINLVARSLDLEGKTVITTDKEHNSNHVIWAYLAQQGTITHHVLSTINGEFDMQSFEQALHDEVALVSVQHHSNVDGITYPVEDIVKKAHNAGARVLIDGAQSLGHIPVHVRKIGCDFYVASGHKLLGPTGTGILYGTTEALESLTPFLLGGDTVDDATATTFTLAPIPRRFEAGLQDYAGIIGLGAAITYLEKQGVKNIHKHTVALANQLRALLKEYDFTLLNSQEEATVITAHPPNMDAHSFARMLSSKEIYARSGTFCCHAYFNKHNISAAVRLALYCYNTEEDITRLKEALEELKDIL